MNDTNPETITNEPTGQEYSVGEIENSNRIQKSVTPKGTFDWYLKWASSILILISLTFRSTGPEFYAYDIAFGWIGIVGWLTVSILWKDRALILLNGVSLVLLSIAILNFMTNS
mgnify:CR=1 FL=1